MKDLYFFDDKGISTLIKTIIKKLFESPNYINMRKQISSLREDVDKISTSSNEIVPCRCSAVGNGIFDCLYPPGFNANNTMIVGTYASSLVNGSPGQFTFENAHFLSSEFRIQLNLSYFYQPSGEMYVYVMKRPSA